MYSYVLFTRPCFIHLRNWIRQPAFILMMWLLLIMQSFSIQFSNPSMAVKYSLKPGSWFKSVHLFLPKCILKASRGYRWAENPAYFISYFLGVYHQAASETTEQLSRSEESAGWFGCWTATYRKIFLTWAKTKAWHVTVSGYYWKWKEISKEPNSNFLALLVTTD